MTVQAPAIFYLQNPQFLSMSAEDLLGALPRIQIAKVAEIDTLRMVIFKDQNIQIRYFDGESYLYKRYAITLRDGETIIDTAQAVFKGGLCLRARDLELVVEDDEMKSRAVFLPLPMKKQLLDFIVEGPPVPTFCCSDFMQKLFDRYHPLRSNVFDSKEWLFVPFTQQEKPEAGCPIALTRRRPKKESLKHFAISLGNDLYLSVAGNGGNLNVTTLGTMKKLYHAYRVYQLLPKSLSSIP